MVIRDQNEIDFESWWSLDGRFIDPDTEDVDWFDKRKELAQIAWIAARKPVHSATMREAIRKASDRFSGQVATAQGALNSALESLRPDESAAEEQAHAYINRAISALETGDSLQGALADATPQATPKTTTGEDS